MALLAAYLEKLDDIAVVFRGMDKAFDLDVAVGNQLDVLGDIVGAKRLLDFEPYYASALLSDDYFRLLVRAKISLNHWDGTIEGIQESWSLVKNGYRLDVIDNQDMTMLLRVHGLEDLFDAEIISHGYLAPKPEGVLVHYLFVMQSIIDGNAYLGSALVSESVTDDLGDYSLFPERVDGHLYMAGAMVFESVTEELKEFKASSQEIDGNVYCGGAFVYETITEVLGG